MLRWILVATICVFSPAAFGQTVVEIGPETRPATMQLASSPSNRPLLLVLHGFGMDQSSINSFFSASQAATDLDYHLIIPNGRLDPTGTSFWDATDACCDFFSPQLGDTDELYLMNLVYEAIDSYNIKRNEIYIAGFSNGAFMANRLACDYSEVFAGIASFSGVNYADPQACRPKHAVSVLQVHGTEDPVIAYEGGFLRAPFPSAADSARQWADRNDCKKESFQGQALELSIFNADLSQGIPPQEQLPLYFDFGNETDVTDFTRCKGNHRVSLWTMNGLGHAPIYQPDILLRAMDVIRKVGGR